MHLIGTAPIAKPNPTQGESKREVAAAELLKWALCHTTASHELAGIPFPKLAASLLLNSVNAKDCRRATFHTCQLGGKEERKKRFASLPLMQEPEQFRGSEKLHGPSSHGNATFLLLGKCKGPGLEAGTEMPRQSHTNKAEKGGPFHRLFPLPLQLPGKRIKPKKRPSSRLE